MNARSGDMAVIRRANFLLVLSQFLKRKDQSQATFSEASGVVAPHITQLKGGKRQLGENVARRMETRLGLKHGWMDDEHPITVRVLFKTRAASSIEKARKRSTRQDVEDALVREVLAAMLIRAIKKDDIVVHSKMRGPFGVFRVGVFAREPRKTAVDIVRITVTNMDSIFEWVLAQAVKVKESAGHPRYGVVFWQDGDSEGGSVKLTEFIPKLKTVCEGAVSRKYITSFCVTRGAKTSIDQCVGKLLEAKRSI